MIRFVILSLLLISSYTVLLQGHNGSHEGYAILYTEENFRGDSYRMFPVEEAGRKADLDNGLVSFQFETIRSIELRGDIIVELWSNNNFRGQSVVLSNSSTDLRNLPPARQNWGGRINSLKTYHRDGENHSPIGGPVSPQIENLPDLGDKGGVVIYSEPNFGGYSYVFDGLEPAANLNQLYKAYRRWNDKISSIYIQGPFTVYLYKDTDFQGDPLVIDESIDDLSNIRRSNGGSTRWGNAVSSIEFERKGRSGSRGSRRKNYAGSLYENDNFSGEYFKLYEGQVIHNLREWSWNDEASSIMVEEGFEVVLFKDSNFRGGSVTFDKDQPSFRRLSQGWNDNTSSLKVIRVR
jgi:hypothetical protein